MKTWQKPSMSITHIEQTETHPSRNYSSQHGWVTDRPKISSHEIAIPPFKHQKSLESLFKKNLPSESRTSSIHSAFPRNPAPGNSPFWRWFLRWRIAQAADFHVHLEEAMTEWWFGSHESRTVVHVQNTQTWIYVILYIYMHVWMYCIGYIYN